MKRHARPIGFALLLGLVACGSVDDPSGSRPEESQVDANPLVGVWKMKSSTTVVPGRDPRATPHYESLIFFTETHYSMGWAGGPAPSPFSGELFKPNPEEKVARYSSVIANSGTYSMKGSRLIIEPLFALVPEFVGGRGEFEVEMKGDALHLRWVVIDSSDGQSDPWIAAGVRYNYVFTRMD